jgi:hypothetical protein
MSTAFIYFDECSFTLVFEGIAVSGSDWTTTFKVIGIKDEKKYFRHVINHYNWHVIRKEGERSQWKRIFYRSCEPSMHKDKNNIFSFSQFLFFLTKKCNIIVVNLIQPDENWIKLWNLFIFFPFILMINLWNNIKGCHDELL